MRLVISCLVQASVTYKARKILRSSANRNGNWNEDQISLLFFSSLQRAWKLLVEKTLGVRGYDVGYSILTEKSGHLRKNYVVTEGSEKVIRLVLISEYAKADVSFYW